MNSMPGVRPPLSATLQTVAALALECVVLDVAPGITPSGKPPVRIFLGTEEAQQRAERVFLYSVRKHRDPARVYLVYLMKDLPGFDRRGWRTGFTQYRFAVPELAGGGGRAIYNDVDQIYLADPAALFDLDLDGHGYLAIAANDTSVMVLDCARMLPWWHLAAARQRGKRDLVQAPAATPGLWGQLDAGWNARDLEYRAGQSRLLHYTTLHLQPWRPTPEQYSYHPHPLGELWLGLERAADAEGYQPFSAARPSAGYQRLLAARRAATPAAAIPAEARAFLAAHGVADRLLLCTLDAPPAAPVSYFNPAVAAQWPTAPAPGLVVVGLLERVPVEDIPWLLAAAFALTQRALYLRIELREAVAAADRPPPARLRRAADWWRDCLAAAAERHPGVAWQLDLVAPGGTRQRFRHVPAADPPQVWVLLGRHEGDNRQLLALAEALGWPYQTRQLVFKDRPPVPSWLDASLLGLDRRRSAPLAPPWPDLVLGCGRRSAPIARWIRRRSGGTALLVHLGRPRAPLKAFDLVVTTPQYQLPARDNVLHNLLPLSRLAPRQTERAVAAWRPHLAPLPRPWLALLVGGDSSSSLLSAETASRLRLQAEARARRLGGSLLTATSPRTPAAAADILVADSAVPGLRYRWRPNDADNPYPAFLALADEFIVTGDSASMLADACASGRPVRYVPLPRPRPRRRPSARLFWLVARRRVRGERGTPRQQGRLARWLDALVAAGLLRPPRDLHALHAALRGSGFAQPLDDPHPAAPPPPITDLEQTVAAVRRLFRRGRAVGK